MMSLAVTARGDRRDVKSQPLAWQSVAKPSLANSRCSIWPSLSMFKEESQHSLAHILFFFTIACCGAKGGGHRSFDQLLNAQPVCPWGSQPHTHTQMHLLEVYIMESGRGWWDGDCTLVFSRHTAHHIYTLTRLALNKSIL